MINLLFILLDEGYQRRVTVDDEDSTILVYDNWKQVSHVLSTHKNTHAQGRIHDESDPGHITLCCVYFTDAACINSDTR